MISTHRIPIREVTAAQIGQRENNECVEHILKYVVANHIAGGSWTWESAGLQCLLRAKFDGRYVTGFEGDWVVWDPRACALAIVPKEKFPKIFEAMPAVFPMSLDRCAACGWPLAADAKDGCVRGNCSQRPLPEPLRDAVRYDAEQAKMAKGVAP